MPPKTKAELAAGNEALETRVAALQRRVVELERAEEAARALAQVGRELVGALDPAQAADRVVSAVLRLFKVRHSALYRFDPSSGALTCAAVAGVGRPSAWLGRTLPAGAGLSDTGAGERRPTWSRDVVADTRIPTPEWLRERLREDRLGAVASIPLIAGDGLLGALLLADTPGRPFTPDDLLLLSTFADQAALALDNVRLHEEAQRRVAELATVQRVAQTINSTLRLEEVFQTVVTQIRAAFGYPMVSIYLRDGAGLTLQAYVGYDEVIRFIPLDQGMSGRVASSGQAEFVRDATQDTDFLFAEPGIRQAIIVPLTSGDGQILGTLAVESAGKPELTEADFVLLRLLADQVSVAVANARLYAETTRRQEEAEELARMARTLTEIRDVTQVADRIVQSVLPLFTAKFARLRLLQPDGSLMTVAGVDASGVRVAPGGVLPPGIGLSGLAVARGETVTTKDLLNEPRIALSDPLRHRVETSGNNAMLAVPLRVEGETLGVLSIADRVGREFSESEASLLQTFADQAALTLANARIYEEAERGRREAEVLAEVARSVSASLDVDTVLQRVVDGAKELCGSDLARIALRHRGSEAMVFSHVVGAISEITATLRVEPGKGIGGLVLTAGQLFRTDNYAEDPRITKEYLAIVQQEGIVTTMAVPILIDGRGEGLLHVDRRSPRSFTDRDETILLRLADHAAVAIQNARLYEGQAVRAARLQTLTRLNQIVSSSLSMDEVLREIARAAAELMSAPVASFWIADPVARTLEMRAFSDQTLGGDFPFTHLGFDQGVIGWVATHRSQLNVADVFTDGRTIAVGWWRTHGLTSFLGIPIVHDDSLLAVLALNGRAPFQLGPDEQGLLGSFAAQAATAIRNARLYEQIMGSRDFLRSIAENSADAIITTDARGRITYFSPGAEQMFGYRADEILGTPAAAYYRSGLDEARAIMRRLKDGGRLTNVETGFRAKGDRWVEVSASISRILDADGKLVGTLGVVKDVTERRRTEEALHRRDAILEAVGFAAARLLRATAWEEGIQEVLARLGQATGVSRVYVVENPVGEDGMPPNSQRYEWVAPGIEPQIADSPLERIGYRGAGFARWEETLGRGRPIHGHVRELPEAERSGPASRGVLSMVVVPIFVGQSWWGAIGLDDCLTEREWSTSEMDALQTAADTLGAAIQRKRVEDALRARDARFRALLEGSSDAIGLTNKDGVILYASVATTRIFGYSVEEILGRSAPDLVHRDDLPSVTTLLAELRQRPGAAIASGQFRCRHKDGSWRWIEGVATNLLSEPSVKAFVFNYRDVTERRILEGHLRQAQKMEAVGRLAGGVAHDFNNLLTVIKGRSQLLLARLRRGDPLRRDIELIQKTANRAAALTQQLLAFSRKQMLQLKVFDLNAVVTGMKTMLRRLIGEDIDLVTQLDPSVGRVKADPGQIEQVILNLAVNARDAMPQGGRLALETANVELDDAFRDRHPGARPGRYVMLAMTDTGEGMDAETQSHLFEPFFTTKPKGKGTGLGLATVYGIVKQTGGYIWVDSAPRRGARFEIYLPRVEDPVDARAQAGRSSGLLRGSETVLLVEDERDVEELAREILEARGYTVLAARRPSEALRLADRHPGPIHILVTDVVMPEMSGRELADRLTSVRPDLRVLYMSGYTDAAIVQHGVLDARAAFLQKPFTPEAVTRKVREVLDAPTQPTRD